MSRIITLIAMSAVSVSLLGAAVNASANECGWGVDHCRAAEVNSRLNEQNWRIDNAVYHGDMSYARAHQLHQEDNRIRHEEHIMASMDGGHLTREDQRILNQQENHVGRQIGW